MDLPISLDPNGTIELNKDCMIRIREYSYAYKLVNRFTGVSNTANSFNGLFQSNFVEYQNKSSDGSSIVAPSDPRFYNIDHQILKTDDDSAYMSEYGNVFIDNITRFGEGVGYKIKDLIDPNTNFKISKIKITDPFKMIKNNLDLKSLINKIVFTIENFAMLTFAKTYSVIIDKMYGFNILNLRRSFNAMEKRDERFEVAAFYNSVKEAYDLLLDSSYDIRITIVYSEFQSNISILPSNGSENIVKTQISDLQSNYYMQDLYYNEEI